MYKVPEAADQVEIFAVFNARDLESQFDASSPPHNLWHGTDTVQQGNLPGPLDHVTLRVQYRAPYGNHWRFKSGVGYCVDA